MDEFKNEWGLIGWKIKGGTKLCRVGGTELTQILKSVKKIGTKLTKKKKNSNQSMLLL